MAARAIKGSEFKGIKELDKKLSEMISAMNPSTRTEASIEVGRVLGDAASVIRNQAIVNAIGQDVPLEVRRAIFFSGKVRGSADKDFSALAGVSKRRSMTTWIAGKGWLEAQRATGIGRPYGALKPVARKVPLGGEVAMSLATMYEFGTTFMQPRPFFRTAVESSKPILVARIAAGISGVMEKIANGSN